MNNANRRSALTPFGARSTAAEVLEGVDLSGKRAIVTGGSSGIGLETGRALASAGAEVTLAVRDVDAGARATSEIADRDGTISVDRWISAIEQASPPSSPSGKDPCTFSSTMQA